MTSQDAPQTTNPTTLQDKLIELNRLDKRVRGLRSRLDANQNRHGIQGQRLAQIAQQKAELDTRLKQQQAQIHNLEQEAAAMQERVDKLRETLNTIKTNKEYQAVLVELNTLKSEKAEQDEVSLEHMEKLEELKTQVADITGKFEEQTKLVEKAGADVEEARAEVAESLSVAETEFREAAVDIPREALVIYAKLSDDNDGEAIGYIEIVDQKRREYTCSVSNTMMPPELVNSLITRPDSIRVCPASGVILVMKPEVRESMQNSK